MRLTCQVCGHIYEGLISPTGHDWDDGIITATATCSTDGTRTFTCKKCNETRTEIIPKTGEHCFVASETVAQTKIGTMDDLGYTVYTCQGCGATKKSDYEGYLDCSWRYGNTGLFNDFVSQK